MAVVIDQPDGTSGIHHVNNGWTLTQIATVTELTAASGGHTAFNLLADALLELEVVTGPRGTTFEIASGVFVYLEQFVPEAVKDDAVKVRIIWRGYPLAQYEFDTTLTQVESNKDVAGTTLRTAYIYPSAYLPDPRKAGKWVAQGGFIQKPLPELSVTIKFIITGGSATNTVTDFIRDYEGTINNAEYTIGTIAGPKHAWIISRVRAHTKDAGVSYEMSVTFQYRIGTWDFLVVFINPDDGKPPHDIKGLGGLYVPVTGSSGNLVPPNATLESGDVAGHPGQYVVQGIVESTFPTFSFGPN